MPTATINNVQNAQPNAPVQPQVSSGTSSSPTGIVPFGRAAKKQLKLGQSAVIAPAGWTGGATIEVDIPTDGYMAGVELTINATGGVNGTKTVAVGPDSPWNLFSNIQLTDVNGTPLFALDGYAAFLSMLYGSSFRQPRPDQSTFGFSAVSTGASGTGNFLIKYFFPFEFATDGLGCLPNMDASAKYKMLLTLTDPTIFYSGSAGEPGTLPSLNIFPTLFSRTRPPGINRAKKVQATQPPALGTIQYWTSQKIQVLSGDNTPQLKRTGNLIRNQILVFRDASGVRSTADSTGVTPPSIQYKYDAGVKYNARVDTLRQLAFQNNNFDTPAGVVVFQYTTDPDGTPGHEYGDEWMATTGSTLLELDFTSSAAGTLQVITNDIVAPSDQIYSAAAMDVIGQ